jgi:RHS repeat-associated protein
LVSYVYTYDAAGNRKTKNGTAYTYDGANQMLTAGGVTYGYDANGNQTSRGSDAYVYDHENRLTQATTGGVQATHTYDGDGLRLARTVNSVTMSYTWDVSRDVPVVLQDGTNTYVYGLDLISATDGSGVQTYFHPDGLGSTAALTDGSGATLNTYTYDVFGAIRSETGTAANQWLFAGEQRDSDSAGGMYYLRARYYDPATGRFLGRDPVAGSAGNPQTQNGYAYALNNPTGLIDPLGLSALPTPPGGWTCIGVPITAVASCAYGYIADMLDWFYGELLPAIHAAANAAVGALAAAGSFIIDQIEAGMDAIQDFADAVASAASAFVKSPNCWDFVLGVTGLVASYYLGPLVVGAPLMVNLGRAGLIEYDLVAFSASAAINSSQLDGRQGASWENSLNVAGFATSGGAALTVPLSQTMTLGGYNTAFAAVATTISGVQCGQDVFG